MLIPLEDEVSIHLSVDFIDDVLVKVNLLCKGESQESSFVDVFDVANYFI